MPPKTPFTVRAVYEYTSDHDEDLTFTTGQVIVVNSLDGDEWYEGSFTDPSTGQFHQGMFPANFVEIYNTVPQTPARPKADSSSSASTPTGALAPGSPAEQSHDDQQQSTSSHQPTTRVSTMSNETVTASESTTTKHQEPSATDQSVGQASAPADESTGYVGSFRDRIKAFNARHDAPPVPQANPKHSSFVKKPYVPPPSSYVPQPSPSAHKPSVAHPVPAVNPDFVATETSEEAEAPPVSSLKDRIALLQKTQLEQQAAAAKSKQKSHEKHPHHHHAEDGSASPGYESAEEETEYKEVSDISRQDTGGVESESEYESGRNQIPAEVESHHTGSRRSIDSQRSGRKKSHEGAPELNDYTIAEKETVAEEEDDDVVEPERGRKNAIETEVSSEEGEEDEGDKPEEEQGDGVDPEVARKLALRERMAKMSGGMGMNFGMPMGMFGGPPGGKKPSKSKASKNERTTSISPAPDGDRMSHEEESGPEPELKQPPIPLFPVAAPPVPPSHDSPAPESEDKPQERRESMLAVPSSPRQTPATTTRSSHDRKRSSHADLDTTSQRSDSPASPRSGQKIASSGAGSRRDSEEVGLESKSPVRSVPPVPVAAPPVPIISPRAPARSSVDSQVSPVSRAAPPVPGAAPPVPPTGSRPPPIPSTRPAESLRASVSSGHSRQRSHDEEFHSPAGSPGPSAAPSSAPPPPPAAVPPPIPKAAPPPPSVPVAGEDSDAETIGYDADEDTDIAGSLHENSAAASITAPPVPESTRPSRPAPPPVPAAAAPSLPRRAPSIATAGVSRGENPDLSSPRSPHQRAPPPPPPTSPPRASATFPRPVIDQPKGSGVRRSSTMKESSAPSRTGISRASTDMRGSRAGQEPVEEETLLSAHDLDLPNDGNDIWWVKPGGAPSAIRKLGSEVMYEIDDSSQTHRGGRISRTREIYILYPDYSQTEIVASYDESNPKEVKIEQVHTASPDRPSPERLRRDYGQFGIKAFDIASKLVGTEAPANTGATSMIDLVIEQMPDVLKPIGNKTFGVCIYKNLANASVRQIDEIRPGDVVTIKNAKFSGHKGSLHQKYTTEIDDLSGGIVSEWDGSKKKLRIINLQQHRSKKSGGDATVSGKVKAESFRLNDLKSGQVKVFRLVGRDFVGWDD